LEDDEYPPQAIRLGAANAKTVTAATARFKREAPKGMKKEDLSAKSWIIADRQAVPMPR
jgi:hypothetical protein